MLKLNASTKFKRDYKTCAKRGYDLSLLQGIVDTLRVSGDELYLARTGTHSDLFGK